MLKQMKKLLGEHFKQHSQTYFFLFLAFAAGISAGSFTVNGLSSGQREELKNYLQGFLQLLDNQQVDNSELLKVSLLENMKIAMLLWLLGFTIIGIPFIYLILAIRGFITGFSAAFLIQVLGTKGAILVALTVFPKEMLLIPGFLAIAVNGINFSLRIIRNRSLKRLSKENLKTHLVRYCFVAGFFCILVLLGILVEAYVVPVMVRIAVPYLIE